MPSRLKFIKTKFSDKKRIFKPLKYPDIPLSIEDVTGDYVIMSGGYIPGNNYGDDVGFD